MKTCKAHRWVSRRIDGQADDQSHEVSIQRKDINDQMVTEEIINKLTIIKDTSEITREQFLSCEIRIECQQSQKVTLDSLNIKDLYFPHTKRYITQLGICSVTIRHKNKDKLCRIFVVPGDGWATRHPKCEMQHNKAQKTKIRN